MLHPIMNQDNDHKDAGEMSEDESLLKHGDSALLDLEPTKVLDASPVKQPLTKVHTKIMTFPSLKSREEKERERTKRRLLSPRGQLITGVTINMHHQHYI